MPKNCLTHGLFILDSSLLRGVPCSGSRRETMKKRYHSSSTVVSLVLALLSLVATAFGAYLGFYASGTATNDFLVTVLQIVLIPSLLTASLLLALWSLLLRKRKKRLSLLVIAIDLVLAILLLISIWQSLPAMNHFH